MHIFESIDFEMNSFLGTQKTWFLIMFILAFLVDPRPYTLPDSCPMQKG